MLAIYVGFILTGFLSATLVYVNFNKSTDLGGQLLASPFGCSLLLDASSILLLGSTAICTWVNSTQLQITISLDATIGVGSYIGVKEETIYAGEGSSAWVTGIVAVESPLDAIVPYAEITGPQFSSCDGLVSHNFFKVQNTKSCFTFLKILQVNISGTLNRPSNIDWKVNSTSLNTAALEAFLQTYCIPISWFNY